MKRLKWLMVFRVVLAVLFIGILTWVQFKQTGQFRGSLYPLYAIIITTCFLTILYAVVFTWVANARLFAHIQIALDIFLITATVYVAGGIESVLSFLYFLSIISASILLNRRGGFYAASASSMSYGALIALDFYKVFPKGYKAVSSGVSGVAVYDAGNILATAILHIIGFFTVAFLTGYLAERTVRVEKELEEKTIDLRKLETIYKYIVENINSGILTIDARSMITSFNKAAEKITGYNLDDVYNKEIDMIFPGLMSTRGYSITPPDDDPSYFRIDKTLKRKDGKELFLGFSVSPMKEGGHIIIFQDLTRLRDIEEHLRRVDRVRALGELAAGMAHEVRNPLASISGSVQVLRNSLELYGENKHLLNIIVRESDRLNALITDFLLFAKPATKVVKIDLGGVIKDTIDMFKNSSESRNIDIHADLKGDLTIEGDNRQLKQVFWNLFLNASHAMPDGGRLVIKGRHLSARQSLSLDEAEGVEISVSDTGHGIREEHIEKVFDPFFTMNDAGTGLGLAVVHRIIEGHKGIIEVVSKKGEGATFKIKLPVKRAEKGNATGEDTRR